MLRKLVGEKVIIGYDLGSNVSRISYCYVRENSNIETLSSVAGEEIYNIPTFLCKRQGSNQWFFGNEAMRFQAENPGQGIPVDHLLESALDGETLMLEGTAFDPVSLLTLFVRRSLGLLTAAASKILALMVTCDQLTPRMQEVLKQVVEGLQLKYTRVYYQSHAESFYYYMLYQPKELWQFRTVVFEYRDNVLFCMSMECNNRTTPIVAFIDERQYEFAGQDQEFLKLAKKECEERRVSSVYLIGEKFSGGWMKESLRYLCRNRRVFQGSNLYSKGAVCCLMDKHFGSENGRTHVFLGKDKLKANVGMRVNKRGENTYFALLDAGVNWYEAEYFCDLYLQEENDVELLITPLTGKPSKTARITLEGLEIGPQAMTRIRMRLYMRLESVLGVELWDLGFGEFRPATKLHWQEEIELY